MMVQLASLLGDYPQRALPSRDFAWKNGRTAMARMLLLPFVTAGCTPALSGSRGLLARRPGVGT
jgi:hypothetical protein